MTISLWLFATFAAFCFAYTMAFTQSTLTFGKELSDTGSDSGYQDAITPPWQTNLALATYAIVLAAIITMWWYEGWLYGVGSIVFIIFGSGLASLLLPKKNSKHFRGLIMRSMCNRYANFSRDGDNVRAQAMKDLLLKSGIDVDQQ